MRDIFRVSKQLKRKRRTGGGDGGDRWRSRRRRRRRRRDLLKHGLVVLLPAYICRPSLTLSTSLPPSVASP